MILPGRADAIEESDGGRAITVWLKSPSVPFSPNYRLLLRNGAVRKALADYLAARRAGDAARAENETERAENPYPEAPSLRCATGK